MKRCPKCEFIYEDDQTLCDMDGVLLVFDARTLPNPHALQTVAAPVKTARRNRAVPAFATLVLALVLGMVYYVSTQRRPTPVADTPPPATTASTSNPVPEVNPTPEAQPSPEEPTPAAESVEEPQTTKAAATAATVKKVAAKPSPTPAKAKVEEKKDDSKVGNILKKTGRILKKPFKF